MIQIGPLMCSLAVTECSYVPKNILYLIEIWV